MNSSLWSAGRNTHLKIVAVALMASIVVIVGINSRVESGTNQIVVKAGQPTVYTDTAGPTIR